MKLKVSIIITSFNRGHCIGNAIRSALRQNYENLEVIVTDNCSTDNTDEVIKEFLSDKRFIYSKNAVNIGMIENFSKGINELATGDFVSFISSDDYLVYDNFISDAVKLIEKYNNLKLVFSKCGGISPLSPNEKIEFVNSSLFKQEYYHGRDLFIKLTNNLGLGFGGCLLNREIAIKNGIFQFNTLAFDAHIVFKLLLQVDCALINKIGYIWSIHEGNNSKTIQTEIDGSMLNYIPEVYNFGIQNKLMDPKLLNKWRISKLKRRLKFAFVNVKIKDPESYLNLKQISYLRYPDIVKTLESDFTLQVFLLLSKQRRIVLFLSRIFLSAGEFRFIKDLYVKNH